ncbi:MAG TPA: ABC-F family ATP-binding cassette domain-containing protein, partial [Candidatus Bathyarchaeia archaeon]|nr:ABC-F family ATP-binding cassette domain-containing protein [Candidatus Bathyarchaeia archaeon]
MSILRLEKVRREVGTFVILDDITAAIAVDDRIGLVGPNGAGKTTLLRIAAGRDEPDDGTVSRRRNVTIGLLAQESHFDVAFMAAPDLRAAVRHGGARLESMAEELAAMEREGRVEERAYADLLHEFDVLGGYTLDQRVDEALSGLGFSRDEWTKPPTALSGGEQTRATLARLVIAEPDLLMLDEPTNHLDIAAIEWLEEHLRRRHGALLVASHDRAFLDATVTRIWELRDRRLTAFRGDYSAFHRQRAERDVRAAKDADTQADQIEREKELVQRYRSHRKFSKMHEHEARLERLQADRVEAPKSSRRLRLPTGALAGGGSSRSGEIVVRAEGLVVGYLPGRGAVEADGSPAREPHRVATAPFLAAQRGDRIGIVGPNGAGKTTLLRTIAGDLHPLDGKLTFGNAVQPGYLAQLRDAAIPGTTVLDALLEAIPVTPGEARAFLARFLFRGEDVFKEVRALSGGERSRLELALLGIMPSNLLLLDEPTNHLDIPAREAIVSFMTESSATLLVVSHDRRLLETVCTSLWVVDDGLAVSFPGGWREWRQAVSDGWTIRTAAEREAERLRGGRPA